MAIFLALTWAGGHWKSFYTASYVLKTILAAAALIYFRKHYTRIRWNAATLALIVGILGIVQWVGMELLLRRYWPGYPKLFGKPENPDDPADPSWPFNPFAQKPDGSLVHFASVYTMWAFVMIRWAGAALVVPFMEELFWRDYLWRTIIAPNDFKLARVGEWSAAAAVVVSLAFATVHIQWMTAVVWGAMIAALLAYTKSLGACIIAHGVTNFLLGAYVLYAHYAWHSNQWFFW
jgi:membrane protease YdiL (CAAX protease family)